MNQNSNATVDRLLQLTEESLADLRPILLAMTEYLTSCSVIPLWQLQTQARLSYLVERLTVAHSQFKSMMEKSEFVNGRTPLKNVKEFSAGSAICSQLIDDSVEAWELVKDFAERF